MSLIILIIKIGRKNQLLLTYPQCWNVFSLSYMNNDLVGDSFQLKGNDLTKSKAYHLKSHCGDEATID